jgi:hypothetical protein
VCEKYSRSTAWEVTDLARIIVLFPANETNASFQKTGVQISPGSLP